MADAHYNLSRDFDFSLVTLSIFLAVFVAYACIELTRCIILAPAEKQKRQVIGGAIVIGIGLWASQLAAMYSLRLPIEIHYHLRITIYSLLIAIISAAVILNVTTHKKLGTRRWVIISISIGLLMTGMNMIGLQAIQAPATTEYRFDLVALAAISVIIATAIVSRHAVKLRKDQPQYFLQTHLIALFVGIGLVISYTLVIYALTFSTSTQITEPNLNNNIYAYQALYINIFAAILLWGSILYSRWQAREGIKTASKIAGLTFGLVLITASTIGAIAFTSSKAILTEQQLKSHLNKLELEEIQLQNSINNLTQDTLVLAHTPPVMGILRAQKNNGIDKTDGSSEKIWDDRLAAIFSGFLQAKPTYLQIYYISTKNNNHEIVSVARLNGTIHRTYNRTLSAEVKKYILNLAKEKPGYQSFLSYTQENKEQQKVPVLRANVPIKNDSGELLGIVIIKLDLPETLKDIFKTRKSENYFSSPDGIILFSQNTEKISPETSINNRRIQDIFPIMTDIIKDPEKITGSVLDTREHDSYFLNYRKIRIDKGQDKYFLRITRTPYIAISRHVLPVLNKFSTVVLVLIGISAILASILARVITHPLKIITLATKQFSRGDSTIRLPETATGEFGILARAFQDMTDKVEEREKSIAQSESFVRSIVESAADGLITVDENGTVISFNLSAQSIFGYPEDEIINKNIKKLIPERFHNGHENSLAIYTKTSKGEVKPLLTNVTGLRKNNEEFPAELSVNRIRSSQTPLFICIIRDITIREKSATNMRLVNRVLESTPEGIVITDAKGIIIRTNPAFEEITGYSPDEVIGKTPSLLKSGRHNNDFFKHMWRSITENGIWQGEIWDKRKSGEIYPKWLNISAIKNDDDITTHYVGLFSDITERKEVEKRLEHLAHYDALTGLPNRALFHDRLLHSLEFARRSEKGLAVMMLDLDRFKIINDTLGHDIGDLLLIEAAKRLQDCLRKVDTVARMGGDEFTVILSDLNNDSDAIQIAKTIIDALSKPFTLSGHDCFVGVSIGISSFPTDGNNPKALIKNADTAMYRAKEMGRNTYQIFNISMSEKNAERLDIETKLRTALQNNELEIYYQPQIDLKNGRISAMEALLRWHHEKLGMIAPNFFIPIAEESGLIIDIGHWILRSACQQYKDWEKAGLSGMSVLVNLSAQQILQPHLAEVLRELLEKYGMPAQKLTLEISESTLLDFPAHAISTLDKLSALGVQLAIDDFGTSYSSMGQLKNMPIQTIKIDQSFIQNIDGDGDSKEIVKAVIAMARSLNLQVVAEGVETMDQLAFLKLQGCDAMQGYLYSPPLPLEAISYMLQQGVSPALFGSPLSR